MVITTEVYYISQIYNSISDISEPVEITPSYTSPNIRIDCSGSYRIGNLAIINMLITSTSEIPGNVPMLQFNMKLKTQSALGNNKSLSSVSCSVSGKAIPTTLYKIDNNTIGILFNGDYLDSGKTFVIHGLVVCDI